MIRFADASLNELIRREGHACACGRTHKAVIDYLSIRPGAVADIPQALAALQAKRLQDRGLQFKEHIGSYLRPQVKGGHTARERSHIQS